MGTTQKGAEYRGGDEFIFGNGDFEVSVDTKAEKLMGTGSGVQREGYQQRGVRHISEWMIP